MSCPLGHMQIYELVLTYNFHVVSMPVCYIINMHYEMVACELILMFS